MIAACLLTFSIFDVVLIFLKILGVIHLCFALAFGIYCLASDDGDWPVSPVVSITFSFVHLLQHFLTTRNASYINLESHERLNLSLN